MCRGILWRPSSMASTRISGKDVREISVYSLNSALDTAVRASSAQYDDPDTIARLQIRLEESVGTETGRPHRADMMFWTAAWLLACMVSK